MRRLLLLAFAIPAVLAASLPPSEKPFTCTEGDKEVAARVAEHFINHHHHHGYKFRLQKILSAKAEKKGTPDCQLLLELSLGETKCHIIDPKPLEKCDIHGADETQVNSKCSVTVNEKEGKATIEQFSCTTEAVPAEDVSKICHDCPTLLPLHDPEGLKSVQSAVKKFNNDSNHTSYFRLMEVGRMSCQRILTGMSYFADFAIVETNCSSGVKPEDQDACLTLCDDTARHGLCKSTFLGNGEVNVECQIFDIQNITVFHHHPPPTSANCANPHFQDPLGPPGYEDLLEAPGSIKRPRRPGAFGPMDLPVPTDMPGQPDHFFPECMGIVKTPPTIHPICPFPPPPLPPPPNTHSGAAQTHFLAYPQQITA